MLAASQRAGADRVKSVTDIEASRYSQNGEDGIIAYLLGAVPPSRRFFLEIGCGNGKENNTSALAEDGWRGIAIDRKPARVAEYNALAGENGWASAAIAVHVTIPFVRQLARALPELDVFSIDIDSVDWHIVKAMTEEGFRPRVAVVEYNAAFMDRPITVPYSDSFKTRFKHFYFGAGVQAWRNLLRLIGYRFVTVDSAGVNAFFVRADSLKNDCLDQVRWLRYADNRHHAEEFGPAEKRFARLAGQTFDHCPPVP